MHKYIYIFYRNKKNVTNDTEYYTVDTPQPSKFNKHQYNYEKASLLKLVKLNFVQFMLYRQANLDENFEQRTLENILTPTSEMVCFALPKKTKSCAS